jgi:hypothetical protein
MFRHRRTGQPPKPVFRRQPLPAEREPWTPPELRPQPPALSRAQLQDQTDWSEPEARQLPALRPSSYVPASGRTINVPAANIASPNVGIEAQITPYATVEAKTIGSHNDRARAWLRYSLPLCGAFGVVTTVGAVALYNVPILSWSAFLTFWLSFVAAYVVLLLRYWQHTPEGVALLNTRFLWSHLRREQAHRHAIERELYDAQLRANERRHDVR